MALKKRKKKREKVDNVPVEDDWLVAAERLDSEDEANEAKNEIAGDRHDVTPPPAEMEADIAAIEAS